MTTAVIEGVSARQRVETPDQFKVQHHACPFCYQKAGGVIADAAGKEAVAYCGVKFTLRGILGWTLPNTCVVCDELAKTHKHI